MPIQTNGFDCGYYVARYMSDIIVQGSQQRTIPQVLYMYYYALISCISFIQKIYNELQYYKFINFQLGKDRYSFLHIDEVRHQAINELATCLF